MHALELLYHVKQFIFLSVFHLSSNTFFHRSTVTYIYGLVAIFRENSLPL